MAQPNSHGDRPSRVWIIWLGAGMTVVVTLLVLSWWLLPIWQPRLVAEYSPWPEPALRAIHYDPVGDDIGHPIFGRVDARLLEWGSSIGPALRRQFEVGDHQHRLKIIALGTTLAGSPGIAFGTTFPTELPSRLTASEAEALREDLYQLVVMAMADGSSYLPNNAAYLARNLHDPRLVMVFCEYLRGREPPIFEDLEPVVNLLGEMADARAVPFLIPLLPIRHKAHPVVEDALGHCLDDSSAAQVLAATRHPHEVIRTWATKQLWRLSSSPEVAQRLVELISDPERQASLAAIQGVRDAHLDGAGPALLHLVENGDDPQTRLAAVEALGLLFYAPAGATLRTLAQTPAEPLRGPAIVALRFLQPDPTDFEWLMRLLSDADDDIAQKAWISLRQLSVTPEQRAQINTQEKAFYLRPGSSASPHEPSP